LARDFPNDSWALILGGSSGFGLATAQKLAENGMNLLIVHRDRRGAMKKIEPEFEKIRGLGPTLKSWNTDAISAEKREEVLAEIASTLGDRGRVRVLLHSIVLAEGEDGLHTLTHPPEYPDRYLDEEDFGRTILSMGTSLLGWVQGLFGRGLFADDVRIFGLTSEGNEVAWKGYAAVSAAKVALESLARSIATEFAPHGVRCNIIQAGITETPALAAIPGSEQLKAQARLRNPCGRLTLPRDVANVIYLLSLEEAAWINGEVIRVDGGEHISGATR